MAGARLNLLITTGVGKIRIPQKRTCCQRMPICLSRSADFPVRSNSRHCVAYQPTELAPSQPGYCCGLESPRSGAGSKMRCAHMSKWWLFHFIFFFRIKVSSFPDASLAFERSHIADDSADEAVVMGVSARAKPFLETLVELMFERLRMLDLRNFNSQPP